MVCVPSDFYSLHHTMAARHKNGGSTGLGRFSEKAFARVWKDQCFRYWIAITLSTIHVSLGYDQKLQETDLAYSAKNDVEFCFEHRGVLCCCGLLDERVGKCLVATRRKIKCLYEVQPCKTVFAWIGLVALQPVNTAYWVLQV